MMRGEERGRGKGKEKGEGGRGRKDEKFRQYWERGVAGSGRAHTRRKQDKPDEARPERYGGKLVMKDEARSECVRQFCFCVLFSVLLCPCYFMLCLVLRRNRPIEMFV